MRTHHLVRAALTLAWLCSGGPIAAAVLSSTDDPAQFRAVADAAGLHVSRDTFSAIPDGTLGVPGDSYSAAIRSGTAIMSTGPGALYGDRTKGLLTTTLEGDPLYLFTTSTARKANGYALRVGIVNVANEPLAGRLTVGVDGNVFDIDLSAANPFAYLGVITDRRQADIAVNLVRFDDSVSTVGFLAIDEVQVITPLPAGMLLLGSAMGGLAFWRVISRPRSSAGST